jgi:uncharacterized membrane protein YbhN (UPF0104 family)
MALLTMLAPIQSVGGLGTTEAGWTIGLISVGIAKSEAIILGFGLHLCVIICMTLVGGFSYLYLLYKHERITPEESPAPKDHSIQLTEAEEDPLVNLSTSGD